MSVIPHFDSYSGVPEYTVSCISEHPPLAFPSSHSSVSISLCLDDSPDFFNSLKPTDISTLDDLAAPIPNEGEFFFVPNGFVPVLMVESLTSVIEYNFPPEVIPLTQPIFASPLYPVSSMRPFISSNRAPPPTPSSAVTQGNPAKAKKAPRPTNAFILFRRENHGRIFQQNPHLSNNDVSKTLGKEWKALPEFEKEKYRRKAKSLQQEHQEKYPDYKFTPQPNRRKRTKPGLGAEMDDEPSRMSHAESAQVSSDARPPHNPFHILYIPKVSEYS
ncbi:hypothetical protein K7432_001261 [Basidiobolus ranarum]|uniref:HMG box domain-containing protein n=1 Tax=Basidiobolus ranarum TaxID=34480 RepID=A0ABR2X376_9FUNG